MEVNEAHRKLNDVCMLGAKHGFVQSMDLCNPWICTIHGLPYACTIPGLRNFKMYVHGLLLIVEQHIIKTRYTCRQFKYKGKVRYVQLKKKMSVRV